jgi:hypothetical protein
MTFLKSLGYLNCQQVSYAAFMVKKTESESERKVMSKVSISNPTFARVFTTACQSIHVGQ